MSAAFQHLLVRWIDAFTELSGKEYSCGINKTNAAADELQRQQTLQLELSEDHAACHELHSSINDLVNRWGMQITNIPMGTKECKEANDTYDAFITDRKLATVPADIVRQAKQLEQLLNEVSQNIETLQASADAKPKPTSAQAGASANQRPAGLNTSSQQDAFTDEPVVLHLTYSLDDIHLEQYNLADHNPFYTQASVSYRYQPNQLVPPFTNRRAPHGHFGTMRVSDEPSAAHERQAQIKERRFFYNSYKMSA